MADEQEKPNGHPRKALQIRTLSNSRAVRRANLKIINAVLTGEIEPAVGNCALYGLNNVQRSIDSELVEARLQELEDRAQSQATGSDSRRQVGYARH
jgi:hypothetical protein